MLSKLEDALLRSNKPSKPNGGFRGKLFAYLDDGVSLRRLRTVSRVLHDLVDHHPERMFRNLKITAPLDEQQDVSSLEIVLPFCHNLTITILSDTRTLSGSSAPHSGLGDDDRLSLRSHHSAPGMLRSQWRREARIKYELMLRASVSPSQLLPVLQLAQKRARQRWLSVFSRCHQLRTLTLRVHGDPSWPGRTKVEDALVDIRTSLEQSPLPKVREVRLTPLHAMGVVHLRWTGCSSFGALLTADKGPVIWARLEVLDLQLRNPFLASSTLKPVQVTMFKKVLYDYFRSFAPTLRRLRFVWLNGNGPSPLTLHLETELEGRPTLKWDKLEELWIGNTSLPYRAMQLASTVAPNLERLWTLKATHRDSSMDSGDPDAWISVMLDKGKCNVGMWTDTTSSIYSQSARSSAYEPSEVDPTSMLVPFMLDLNWQPPL